jgi:hypothetical protein
MSDTFQYYGTSFQHKVIAALMSDRIFLQQIHDILDPNYFSSDGAKWLVGQVLEYFVKYKTPPTLDVFKISLDNVESDLLKTTVKQALKEVLTHLSGADQSYVKDQTINFCKNQKLRQAILDSVEMLKVSNYDGIKLRIDDAMKAGTDRNIGHEYAEHIEERFAQATRKTSPTPWEPINDITDGGIGAGELAVFVAPAGIGKSMALVNVAAHAIKEGKTVFYYTLELNEAYVGARFDSFYTGVPSSELKHHKEEVEKYVRNLPGKLVVKYYPTKTATINTITAHLEKSAMQGYKPDMVIVDYADLLRDVSNKSSARHDQVLGNIYEDLRGVAGSYQIPIYTASQANRSALEQEIIEADKIAESYSKVMIADFVVSLSRKVEDKISGTGRWHVIKNRFGPDGITFPSKMNMAVCRINIFEPTSEEGTQVNNTMKKGDEVVRQALSAKFNELISKE